MTADQWLERELDELFCKSQDYKQKALLLAAKQLVFEQGRRIEQGQGKLDGTLWSPQEWGTN